MKATIHNFRAERHRAKLPPTRVMLSEAKHLTYGDWITVKTKNALRVCVRSLPSYLID
jgi:hypothetical protein